MNKILKLLFRYALEFLFRKIIGDMKTNTNKPTPSTTSTKLDKARIDVSGLVKACNEKQPKMTAINDYFRHNKDAWSIIAEEYKLSGCTFPLISNTLLYGVVSEAIHNPDMVSVIVSSASTEDYKVFFEEISNLIPFKYKEFDEELSELMPGEEII